MIPAPGKSPEVPAKGEVTIRPCSVADAATLSWLAADTFSVTFSHTCTPEDMAGFIAANYSVQQFAKELADPKQHIYFALIDGPPVGYLQFSESALSYEMPAVRKPLELLRLYVRPEWQGAGIAAALMDFYLDYARQHGYDYCWLGVWEHNYRAQRFYTKYGFSFSGHTHPFPIGNTPQTDQWWGKAL